MPKQKYKLSKPLIDAIKQTHFSLNNFLKIINATKHVGTFNIEWTQPLIAALTPKKDEKIYISEEHFDLLANIFAGMDDIIYSFHVAEADGEYIKVNKKFFEIVELLFNNCELLSNNKAKKITIAYFPRVISSMEVFTAILIEKQDWQTARNILQKARIYMKQLEYLGRQEDLEKLPTFYAKYHARMATIEARFGNINEAIKHASKADTFIESCKNIITKMSVTISLVKAYIDAGIRIVNNKNFKLALDLFDRALEIDIVITENESPEIKKMLHNNARLQEMNKRVISEAKETIAYLKSSIQTCKDNICYANNENFIQFLNKNGIQHTMVVDLQTFRIKVLFADGIVAESFRQCFKKTNFIEASTSTKTNEIIINILAFDVTKYTKLRNTFLRTIHPTECTQTQAEDQTAKPENIPEIKEQTVSSAEQKQQKLERHLENEQKREVEKKPAESKEEVEDTVVINKPKKTKEIIWNDSFVPPTDLFRVYTSVNNLKSFATISEDLELPTELDANKVHTVASYGNVLTNDRQGRQGYFFSKTDPTITRLGPNYKGKLILRGESGVGDHRAMMQVIGTGKEITRENGEVVKQKNIEVLSIDHFEGTHRKNKN